MASWHERYLVEPLDELLTQVPIAGEVQDLERCRDLATGIEAVFRNELPELTTDGISIDLCVRTGVATLDVVGLMWIDFGGELFPYRAEIVRHAASVTVTGYIGQVDGPTGKLPRLPRDTLILPVRDENNKNPVPHLIVGRRQLPLTWTKVLAW